MELPRNSKTLRNAIESNRIANAYLFIGPRGIGKTTTSRIFAKALNCTSPNGVEPCCKECNNAKKAYTPAEMILSDLGL